jgi:hypothetical protein
MFIPDPNFYPSWISDPKTATEESSVADPGCLSRIPDPRTATKERGEKKFDVIPFYVATNFTKLYIILVEVLKKKMWANFQRIIELFPQKIVTKLSKVWVWDPGSGKNLFRIPDQGVKKAPDPDPQHWKRRVKKICCHTFFCSHKFHNF